jgi:hypothetical protein
MARQEEGEGEVAAVASRARGGGGWSTTARGKSAAVVGEEAAREGEEGATRIGKKWRNSMDNDGRKLTREEDPRWNRGEFHRLMRNGGRIDESKAPTRSSRRDERNGTLGFLPTTHRLKVIAHWSWDHPRTSLELSSD